MSPSPAKSTRILVIDDNVSIHADFKKILGQGQDPNRALNQTKAQLSGENDMASLCSGFAIDSAFQGEEGLEMAKRAADAGAPYALAFVDLRMPPGWDGVETIGHLWKCCPDLQVVICTAYADYSWKDAIQKLGHSPNLAVLKKPFDDVEVLQLAHALTEKWHLNRQGQSQLNDPDVLVPQRTGEPETAHAQLKEEKSAECILVVDDEDHLRTMLAAVLRKNGYRVLEAASGPEALDVFNKHRAEVNLLFTDVRMPGGLLGDELAARLAAAKPSLAVLFMSGYTPNVRKRSNRRDWTLLAKPFAPDEMLVTVRQCLDHAPVEYGANQNQ